MRQPLYEAGCGILFSSSWGNTGYHLNPSSPGPSPLSTPRLPHCILARVIYVGTNIELHTIQLVGTTLGVALYTRAIYVGTTKTSPYKLRSVRTTLVGKGGMAKGQLTQVIHRYSVTGNASGTCSSEWYTLIWYTGMGYNNPAWCGVLCGREEWYSGTGEGIEHSNTAWFGIVTRHCVVCYVVLTLILPLVLPLVLV